MDTFAIGAVLVALLGAVFVGLAWLQARTKVLLIAILNEVRPSFDIGSETTLEGRLGEMTELMGKSAILAELVSTQLDARKASLRVLQEDARTAEALAALHRDKAEAVRRMLDAELAAHLATNRAVIRKDVRNDVRKDSIRIGIGSFVAGGGITFFVTLLVHPLH